MTDVPDEDLEPFERSHRDNSQVREWTADDTSGAPHKVTQMTSDES